MSYNDKFKYALCFCQLLIGFNLFSQDLIIFKTGDELSSKVIEILPDMIKYKKWENQEGPTYSVNKADIFMIKYQNGTKDVFTTTTPNQPVKPVDNTTQVVETARTFMTNQIATESNGACRLVDFQKQNGVEKEVFGQKIYTLEYRLLIELQRDFWKASSDKFLGKDWYWTNFSVLDKKGDIYAETYSHNYNYFTKGSKVQLTGEIEFENTDNGWRISGKSMFSAGYKNKTSNVIFQNNPAAPQKEVPLQSTADSLANALKGKYTGDLKDGKKEGQGKMLYDNGNIYEGEWHNDQKSGIGKMLYKNGVIHEGTWKDDKREGNGTVTSPDGRKFIGSFSNDLEEGKGILYNKEGGKIFEGEHKKGLKDGPGVLTIEDHEAEIRHEGLYKNDQMNGQGTVSYKDKKTEKVETFTGEFKDDAPYNGTLVEVNRKGEKRTATIVNGKQGKYKKERPASEK